MAESKSDEIKVTIGEEKALYISTLSDLGGEMLKLDFPMGEYELYAINQGYYLGVKDYLPKNEDAIQVFNDRDGHKGFHGTYHDGSTNNVHRLRIFNHFIGEHLPDEWWKYQNYSEDDFETEEFETVKYKNWNDSYSEYYMRGEVSCLRDFNNIPVFFYLTKQISIDDLSNITLKYSTVINDCGNVEVCWHVLHLTEGRIGIAVKQKEFFNMMGEAGLCLFSSNGYRAVGNFYCDYVHNFDQDVFQPYHTYECEFDPCFCDFENDFAIERRMHLKEMRETKEYQDIIKQNLMVPNVGGQ